MKSLVVLALTFITFKAMADIPLDCRELSGFAESLEKQLMSKSIQACNDFAPAVSDLSNSQLEAFSKYKCSDFTVIEQRIKTLENEVALLTGFEKLKNNIREQHELIGPTPSPATNSVALSFVDGIAAAQSIELLLNTTHDGKSFFEHLKSIPESERDNLTKLKASVRNLCAAQADRSTSDLDACNPQIFDPSSTSFREIQALLVSGSGTPEQVNNWREALQVTKPDGTPYSFTEMRGAVLEIIPDMNASRLTLTRQQLANLRAIPDFRNANAPTVVQNLADSQPNFRTYGDITSFKFLVGDLKNRQTQEIQSKASLAFEEYKRFAPSDAPELGTCRAAKTDLVSAKSCMGYLKSIKNNFPEQGRFMDMADGLDYANSYLENLTNLESSCVERIPAQSTMASVALPAGCAAARELLTADQSTLQSEILSLNLLKEKIASDQPRLIKFRNYVLQRFLEKGCNQGTDLTVNECPEIEGLSISREADVLVSDTMNISIVLARGGALEEISSQCAEGTLSPIEARLCRAITPSTNSATPPPSEVIPRERDPQLNPTSQANPVRDAWTQGLSNLMGSIGNGILNPGSTISNPYPYNFAPYSGPKVMSTSDSILFNARYSGAYGLYLPTQGLPVGTAFPQSASTPVMSPYFSR